MDITITLVEDELTEAVKDFLKKHEVVTEGKSIDTNFVAGRGANGHSAVITIKGEIPVEVSQLDPPDVPEPEKAATPAAAKKDKAKEKVTKPEDLKPIEPPASAGKEEDTDLFAAAEEVEQPKEDTPEDPEVKDEEVDSLFSV